MKQLKSIIPVSKDKENLERSVNEVIFDAIFKDVFAVLDEYNAESFENTISELRRAIQQGKIQYSNGEFSGAINAKISRELKELGAVFKRGKWTITANKIPASISSAIAVSNVRFKELYSDVLVALEPAKINEALSNVSFTGEYEQSISGLENQFKTSVKAIGVTPELSKDMIESISGDFNNNMKLYIKDWTETNIVSLREDVTKNMFEGARAENLVKIIQDKFAVSKRKAKFLAAQETRLLSASFTENRYKSAGVTKYRWSSSQDARVRDRHKHLHGKVFAWGEAVIDDKGTRGNPQESFGCRCRAVPIVE